MALYSAPVVKKDVGSWNFVSYRSWLENGFKTSNRFKLTFSICLPSNASTSGSSDNDKINGVIADVKRMTTDDRLWQWQMPYRLVSLWLC